MDKVLTAYGRNDDAALISRYWYIRVQCECSHNTRLAPAWDRLQTLAKMEPDKIKAILGYIPRHSEPPTKSAEEIEEIQRDAHESAAYIQAWAILSHIMPEHIRPRYVIGGILCTGDPRGDFTVTFDEAIRARVNGMTFEKWTVNKFDTTADIPTDDTTNNTDAPMQNTPSQKLLPVHLASAVQPHALNTTALLPKSKNNTKARAASIYDQPTIYDLEEAAREFVLDTLAPNVPHQPLAIVLDGEVHRFKVDGDNDKAACYQFTQHGNGASGWFRYWRVNQDSVEKWMFDFKGWNERHAPLKLSRIEATKEQLRREIAAKNREFDTLVSQVKGQQARDDASTNARLEYQTAKAATMHSYLQYKGVPCVIGLKLDDYGNLLAPLYNEVGEVCNLQRIVWDELTQKYKKLYYAGAGRAGTFLTITETGISPLPPELKQTAIIGICEGLATGLSAFEAIRDTGGIMVCAMDAPNLEPTARIVRSRFANHAVFLFADNDWFTALKSERKINPGLQAAQKAATAIGAAGNVIAPDFDFDNTGASDWNDYAARYGIPTMTRAILEKIKSAAKTQFPAQEVAR